MLISVLWICALIMWFALQIGAEVRLQGEEQVHIFRKSQALHLAIGGSYEALGRMGQSSSLGLGKKGGVQLKDFFSKKDKGAGTDDDWLPDGKPHLIEYQTGQAVVIVEAEKQKVNVNKATPEQIKDVLRKTGMEDFAAEGLADVIADFIDRDELSRLHGAEKDQYKHLGLHYGPFNGPLLSIEQMLLIPGITQEMFFAYGQTGDEEEGISTDITKSFMLPGKNSLFHMFTVYGKNEVLRDDESEETLEKTINWESGGIYRILSCARSFTGPPAVLIWLIVKYAPESEDGYEVLYRKIL